eukprot:198809-Rhodomonas_salina.1
MREVPSLHLHPPHASDHTPTHAHPLMRRLRGGTGTGPAAHGPVVEPDATAVLAGAWRAAEDDGAVAGVGGRGEGARGALEGELRARLTLARIAPVLVARFLPAPHAARLAPEACLGRHRRVPARVTAGRSLGAPQTPLRHALHGVRRSADRFAGHEPVGEERALEQVVLRGTRRALVRRR